MSNCYEGVCYAKESRVIKSFMSEYGGFLKLSELSKRKEFSIKVPRHRHPFILC